MANLDVALRLRLINGLRGPSQEARRDLESVRTSAQRLNTTRGGDGLARDLGRVVTAGGKADAALRRVASDAAGLSATGAAAARIGTSLTGVVAAGTQADQSLRRVASAKDRLTAPVNATGGLKAYLDSVIAAANKAGASISQIRAGERARTLVNTLPPAPQPVIAPAPRTAVRPARAIMSPPPETRQKSAPEAGENPSTIVGLGGRALTAVGGIYATRTAIRATVGEAISFEKAWSEVIKKVNDAPNPEAMQQLQRTVTRTAIDLGISRQGLAELTAEAGAAGTKFEDLERYVRLAAKASAGWDMAPRDASQKLAEIRSAGQMTIGEMDVLANKINALADNSAAREADIVEMFQRAGAPARAAGLKDDTTLAALTALRSGGMQADVASRFFGAFTSKLATAGGEGKGAEKVNDALKLLGLTGAKVAEGMRRDVDGTIVDILDRLGRHAEPVKVATGLMGQEWWDELSRMSGSFKEFLKQREFLKSPSNFKGSLDSNLNIQLATTANHLQRLKALTDDIGDRMGRWALPGINTAIQTAIKQVDELERRKKLNDEKGGGPDALTVLKRMTPYNLLEDEKDQTYVNRKTVEGASWLYRKGLDLTMGELPTQDPSRQVVERASQEVKDAREAAAKSLAEAATFEARAKTTKDKAISGPLMDKAATARREATAHTQQAEEKGRTIGPAGARDMTDVEFGEAAARKSIETMRRLRGIEAGLSVGTQRNIRLPGTGVVMSRSSAEAELIDLRATMKAMTAGADKVTTVRPPKFDLSGPNGQADLRISRQPGSATAFPLSPDIAAPRFDAQPIITAVKQAEDAAKGLQTSLKQDLSGPATESMQSYQGALSTGLQAAIAAAVAAAAQMKTALSFTATPTITPSISAPRAAPAGGAAPAVASPARASGGSTTAPRLQSAGLRQRGGPTFTGPIHVHGVRDVASLERGILRSADRQARDTRDGGLHDLGSLA